jgi:small-conductance mechanosensitive channel
MTRRGLGSLLVFSTVLMASSLTTDAAPIAKPAVKVEPAPVIFDGKTVIEVQWGYGTFSPAVRARGITQRLASIADDRSFPDTVTITPSERGLDLMVGDRIIASVFDGDAEAAGARQEVVAWQWQGAFHRAIVEYRSEHSQAKLVRRTVLTALMVLFTLTVLWGLWVSSRWVEDWVSTAVVRRLRTSREPGLSLIDTQEVDELIRVGVHAIRLALSVFMLYLMFQVLFLIFPQTRPMGGKMLQAVLSPLREFGSEVVSSTPSLIFIVIIAVVCRYVLNLLSFAFAQIRVGRVRIQGFKAHWAPVTKKLLNVLVIVLAVLIAYPYIPGSETPAFKGVSLFLGVLLSLGSTGVVANLFNGIVLTYMDSFQVGDYIEIGQMSGYVESTSLFATRLRTRQGRTITMPNQQVLNSHITNYSTGAGGKTLSLSVTVGIGYDTPWRQVEAILLSAASKTQVITKLPAPFVLETALDSLQVLYELTVFFADQARMSEVRTELTRNILDEFNLYGVQILTPSYIEDPPKPAVVPKENWYKAPAARDPDQPLT